MGVIGPESLILYNYKQLGAAVVLQCVIDYENALVETYIEEEKLKLYSSKIGKIKDPDKRAEIEDKIAECKKHLIRHGKEIQDDIDFFADAQWFSLFSNLDPDFVKRKIEEKAERIIDILKEKGRKSWRGWKRMYGTTWVMGGGRSDT